MRAQDGCRRNAVSVCLVERNREFFYLLGNCAKTLHQPYSLMYWVCLTGIYLYEI